MNNDKKQTSLLVNIVRLLSTEGFSYEQIAEELAIPSREFAYYIIGTKSVDDDTISDLCSIFNITKEDVASFKKSRSLKKTIQ